MWLRRCGAWCLIAITWIIHDKPKNIHKRHCCPQNLTGAVFLITIYSHFSCFKNDLSLTPEKNIQLQQSLLFPSSMFFFSVYVCVWYCDSLKLQFPHFEIPSSPSVPHPGQAGFLGSSGGNIKWPGSLQQTQVIREGSFHSIPSLASSHPLPAFKYRARSKLWGCAPQTSPQGMLEALCSSL